jgi:hypothetical protein
MIEVMDPVLPLVFVLGVSIAVDGGGRPVAQPEWLEAQIEAARDLFAPFGVSFVRTEGAPVDARLADVETRADRDALAVVVRPYAVNVIVVESLRDVDDPTRMRRGVHWHAPSGVHYVILVAAAPPAVLAHELGHFFGNPHSPVADNVMSYRRTGAPVFFDREQGRRLTARAQAYVASGELLPVVDDASQAPPGR